VLQPDQIERALVVTAHPDDVDFGAAGTVAVLTDAGVDVTYCIVTDGEAGGSDRSVSRTDMAALRRREQADAAMHVGVADIIWLGHPDGRVEATLELREGISRVIRQVRPQVVITQSPMRILERMVGSHPDHLAAGEAALCAVYPDSRNPFAFPALLEDGLEPWSVPEVWVMAFGGASEGLMPVDITAQIDRKVKALLSHVSQLPDPDRIVGFVRDRATATGVEAGLPAGTLAETFRVAQI
jgi:LmbE family N-acetylglucosaminyl deacetylase